MAEIKKSKRIKERESGKAIKPWLENKIAAVRKVAKPRAAKASRYGAPAGVALIILIISLSFFLPKNHFQRAKERLARDPNDFEAHLILAEEYLKNNQLEEAEKELLFAQQLQKSGGGILGVAVSSLDQLWWKKQGSNPKDIKELISYWEEVVAEKPDYRDGYLRLALLHFKLYENKEAREYLEKALGFDPNFEPAKEMERILGD